MNYTPKLKRRTIKVVPNTYVAYEDLIENCEKAYEQGRADERTKVLALFKNFINEYDGAIIISDAMGIVSGQTVINELKNLVLAVEEQKEGAE